MNIEWLTGVFALLCCVTAVHAQTARKGQSPYPPTQARGNRWHAVVRIVKVRSHASDAGSIQPSHRPAKANSRRSFIAISSGRTQRAAFSRRV